MGAWGEGPMDNDTALDWMSASVETPLAATIKHTLLGYLEGRTNPAEAEAAVALLIDYTICPGRMKYRHIDLTREAREHSLWVLGIKVIEAMLADSKWMSSWTSAETKRVSLKELIDNLNYQNNPRLSSLTAEPW